MLKAVTCCNISYAFSGTGKRKGKESGKRQRGQREREEISKWTRVQHVKLAASSFVPAMQQNPQH